MKRSLLIASLLVASTLQAACTDAEKAQWGGLGGKFQITLYAANGGVIKQWQSNGKVQAEDHSDGWYFMDAATGKLVRVSGTVIVDQLD